MANSPNLPLSGERIVNDENQLTKKFLAFLEEIAVTGEVAVTLSSDGGSITINTGFDTLAYTKTGDLCHVQGSISVTSVSAPTGTITLNGLPFTSATLTEGADFNRFTVTVTNFNFLNDGLFQGFIQPGNTTLVVQGFDSAALATEVQTGTVFNFSFSYKTA